MPEKRAKRGKGASQEVSGPELEVRRAQRLGTVEAFRAGRTPLAVIEVTARAGEVAARAVEDAARRQTPPALACKKGCDWCCYCRVGTAAPEVLRIAEYLRQTLPPEQLQAVRERVARLDDLRRALQPVRRADPRLPCALLADHRCVAYPVRPLTCRGFNSSDAARCERFVEAPNTVHVPAYAPQLRLHTFVLDGLRAGLTESGLKGDLLELTAALRIALEAPDAAERWLAGEPVFAAARLD